MQQRANCTGIDSLRQKRFSRCVEFTPDNFNVYSIELAHLLFTAPPEVDVVAKHVCQHVSPRRLRGKIDEYCAVLVAAFPDLPTSRFLFPATALRSPHGTTGRRK